MPRPDPSAAPQTDRRAALREVMPEAVARAVMAAMRDDLDALREALVDHAVGAEDLNAAARRPHLRVIEGGGEEVRVIAEPGRIFAPAEDLIAAGIVAPRLQVVR